MWRWLLVGGWTASLTAILLWPQHRPGYGLGHDMVFTPRQPLSWASVGIGSGSPRAVPVDALVASASKIVDGAVVGRIALVFPLLAAGLGVAALVGPHRLVGAIAGAGFAIWNPFVVERLAIGQWALLWAYGALPWVVRYAALSRREPRAIAALALWLAAASITPTGAIVGAIVAVVVGWPTVELGWRRRVAVPVVVVVFQLPWLVPALVGPAAATSDPAGVQAFAARGENSGGPLVSLLGIGGIWNEQVVPNSRSGLLPFGALIVLAAAAVFGWRPLHEILGRSTARRLLVCSGCGLLVAAAATLPGLSDALTWAVREVPGAGLLRDAQKWVIGYAVLLALLFGAATSRLLQVQALRLSALGIALVVPILLLPDAASTLRPTLDPVDYPADWQWAHAAVGSRGAVAVLPFQAYRSFAWAPGRSVLDPAPRLLPGDVVVSDRLAVSGRLLSGEDQRARQVERALSSGPVALPPELAQAGVGWVLVERGTPGDVPDLSGLQLVRRGADLLLYRVPDEPRDLAPSRARIALVLVADGAAAVTVLGAAALLLLRRRARLVLSSTVQS